ncbi:putative MFS family arabinose efflux permease [Sinobaca qinghaiensis]|uniref:Putative MFS family arabinose efflux permease n=1 Tax=Sinobaca qinghaiensis TaxID=342944 RepID=A0A419V826_9BACL|nr:YbfB/YjiJ family MFS transporter [Sinobaca qinghaiensis]RKD76103.1 putative MFS family arabinose efflux permease [Sinobaca qinghaiensis]
MKWIPIVYMAAGFLALSVVMGIGRFAFTPLLPPMESRGLAPFSAGLLASANYTGYFIGAMWARRLEPGRGIIYSGLAVSILTTAAMGLSGSLLPWLVWRLLSGIASGLVFVLTAAFVLNKLKAYDRLPVSGVLYGGVGGGILLSGLLTPALVERTGMEGAWLGFGAVSLLLSIFIWLGFQLKLPELSSRNLSEDKVSFSSNSAPDPKAVQALYLIYACAGFGYIIFGTFVISLLASKGELGLSPSYIWAVVGAAVIPSCLFWAWLQKRIGLLSSLKSAYILQTAAVLLPLISPTTGFAVASAIGYGGSFMGIVALTMILARQLQPLKPQLIMGGLTASYGIGQLLGPLAAAAVTTGSEYTGGFILSAAVLLLGIVLLFLKSHVIEKSIVSYS